MRLYIGLVHFPVYNKNHHRIASAITIVDLHDIARLARTYDVSKYFVITPLDGQQKLAERVQRHWTDGYGATYNECRKVALEVVLVVPSLERAVNVITEMEEEAPLLIATDAIRHEAQAITYEKARGIIQDETVVLLIFGTAWGLDEAILRQADYVLDPISGLTNYNHLSVRSAAAIILDRLAGRY